MNQHEAATMKSSVHQRTAEHTVDNSQSFTLNPRKKISSTKQQPTQQPKQQPIKVKSERLIKKPILYSFDIFVRAATEI